MNFDSLVTDYLTGKKFSNGLQVTVQNSKSDTSLRNRYLERLVHNHHVLHIGFVDHQPLIEKKIQSNQWLHKILTDSASRCFGLDINEEGVHYVKQQLGYKDVMALNILTDDVPHAITDTKWDYIILADVIEHINNPVEFLTQLRERYSQYCTRLIITTPNALRVQNFLNNLKSMECINTDHRYWFTPFTLAKIATEANYLVSNFELCQHSSIPRRQFIQRIIMNRMPFFRDTIVMELDFND